VAQGPRLSMGSYHGHTWSVSIAVQELDAELAGMAQRVQVKVGGTSRGHGSKS
jgi:6-pyruvoyl-tetrahydropterin synthase